MTRIAITLDAHALTELQRRASTNHEPVARTAARLIRDGLLSSQTTPATALPATQARQQTTQPPPWIEPAAKPQQWRRNLWAAVTALHKRYPQALSPLPADWWTDQALTETLAALIAWRTQLDTGAQTDPRTELLFHDRLAVVQRELTQNTDPTSPRFTAGPLPERLVS